MEYAFDFYIPDWIRILVAKTKTWRPPDVLYIYQDFTMGWEPQLEMGFSIICLIHPSLFVAAFKSMLTGVRKVVKV